MGGNLACLLKGDLVERYFVKIGYNTLPCSRIVARGKESRIAHVCHDV